MKYCMPYIGTSKYKDMIDEIYLEIRKAAQVTSFTKFILLHPNQTIIVDLPYEDDACAEIIKCAKKLYNDGNQNFKLMFHYEQTKVLSMVKDAALPFFFTNFANDIDSFIEFMRFAPTDIRVTSPLAFDIIQASTTAHEAGIRIRALPHLAQTSNPCAIHDITSFFIRPQDVTYYEKYIDVFELTLGDNESNASLLDLYYKSYAIDKKYNGKLYELILALSAKYDIYNDVIPPSFGLRRLDCRKKCKLGGICNSCQAAIDNAELLSKIYRLKTKTK